MDLSLASLDDIFTELESRVGEDGNVVLYLRKAADLKERAYAYRRFHKGTYESIIFMLRHLEATLHHEYRESERDPEPWEDF